MQSHCSHLTLTDFGGLVRQARNVRCFLAMPPSTARVCPGSFCVCKIRWLCRAFSAVIVVWSTLHYVRVCAQRLPYAQPTVSRSICIFRNKNEIFAHFVYARICVSFDCIYPAGSALCTVLLYPRCWLCDISPYPLGKSHPYSYAHTTYNWGTLAANLAAWLVCNQSK